MGKRSSAGNSSCDILGKKFKARVRTIDVSSNRPMCEWLKYLVTCFIQDLVGRCILTFGTSDTN